MPRTRLRAALLAAAFACGPIEPPAGSSAPRNVCSSASQCQAYTAPDGGLGAQPGATPNCIGGACLVTEAGSSWVVLVSTATDAYYAPGRTWALPFSWLIGGSFTTPTCSSLCAQLPPTVPAEGAVECQPSAADDASWYLGPTTVTLPVQATFTPQWPSSTSALVDAASIGLPVPPIVAATFPNPLSFEAPPGPGGGPSLLFDVQGAVPDGAGAGLPPMTYERSLMPLLPFEQAFPPDIQTVDAGSPESVVTISGFDTTPEHLVGNMADSYPVFPLSRADGQPLDGWSAYLEDQTTLRRLSNLPLLSGAKPIVQLLTSRYAADALTNAELVMAPPPGEVLPTWFFSQFQIDPGGSQGLAYPALPPSVTAQGNLTTAGARPEPVAADLIFEAIGLCRISSGVSVFDPLSATSKSMQFAGEFSLTQRVSTDDGSFSLQLPQGYYRLTVVPRDHASAVTVVTPFVLADVQDGTCSAPAPAATTIAIQPTQTINGSATLYDGRPLADATIELVPSACSVDPTLDSLPAADTVCLPRFVQAVSNASGSYSVALDPGAYSLRVRPASGSGFPWVVQTMSVTPKTTLAPPTLVPAPVYAGYTLFDATVPTPGNPPNPLVEALVRVYELRGPTYQQIGEALTDAQGHYDMYLAPPQE